MVDSDEVRDEKNKVNRDWRKNNPGKTKAIEQRKRMKIKQRLSEDPVFKEQYDKRKRESQKKYRTKNPEKILDNSRKQNQKRKQRYSVDLEYRTKIQSQRKQSGEKWRKNNPEKVKNIAKKYRLKNDDKIKKWRAKNSEELKKYQKKYRIQNEEKLKFQLQCYDILHSDEISANQRVWRIINEDYIKTFDKLRDQTPQRRQMLKEYSANFKKRHPEVYGEMREYSKQTHSELKYDVFLHYSKNKIQCNCCGENEFEFMTVDHIEGIQKTKHPKLRSVFLYRWLVKNNFPEGYQILCYGCNLLKSNNLVCPHQKIVEKPRSKTYLIQKKYQNKIRDEIIHHYSNGKNECECCGENDIRFLTIDHMMGRKNVGHGKGFGGYQIHLFLRRNNFPKGYRVLCVNCNSVLGKKGIDKCPHKKK
jgi:hypothetical protein